MAGRNTDAKSINSDIYEGYISDQSPTVSAEVQPAEQVAAEMPAEEGAVE